MNTPTRRRLLAALSATAATALSGCSSDDGTASETPTGTPTGTPTDTATPTATEEPATDEGTTTAEPVDPAALRTEARELTVALADGEYERVSDAFTDEAAEVLTPERLEGAWNQTTGDRGPFRAIANATYSETTDGTHVVVVEVTFEGGVLNVRWTFDANGEPVGLFIRPPQGEYSPPEYVDESAFEETELTLPSPACDLGAALSMPTGDGPVPGVVLVHGSGPNDRDLTVGPNKIFRDLAHGLATRGYAVLRYDKRTYACDVSATDDVTIDDVTVDDAVTAVERLREEERVSAVYVAGHSQGGLAAPRIARRSDADGMALLAAPAGDLWELLPMQNRHIFGLDGEISDAEQRRIDEITAQVEAISNGEFSEDEDLLGFDGSFWASLRAYDQTAVAADLDIPAIVQQGGRDFQVPPSDIEDWRAAVGDDRGTYHSYPSLDHLLFAGSGTSSLAKYYEPNNVDVDVVADLDAWLAAR
ncbi:alpha/beta fold hydrolase [Haloarchaeobius salinus]|uniref:alpha/beta fold hydrolase n=1 Tax=Haloarchaeobius salinus TaxID=1198298 RepID=UPI002108B1EC|nr:alpha/beta fold hydrolase [Haloarchaeobius salinus]